MDGKAPAVIPDLPDVRPKTIADARELITRTLNSQPWDADEQARYFKIHGCRAGTVDELSEDEVRQVVRAMESSRMVNFKDKESKRG